MSNADPEEVVTATSDGVSVEKSFEPDDFPVPAIAFVIRADRDETVSVRLVDTVPSHVPPEDIGFHPKYGAEFWGVEGDTIVFEREFEPGEEYTTVYGLRGGDSDDIEQFMSEPTIEDVEPPLDDADAGQTVRDVIGEDEGDEDGEADDEIASAVDDVDTDVDADDGAEPDEPADDGDDPDIGEAEDPSMDLPDPDGATATTAGAGAVAATDAESLVSALADEIRSGDVDDDAVEDLRDALGVEAQSGSEEARIEHLQSKVSDLEAYTEALEEFLDENGDAQQLIADVRADYESIEGRLDAVESTAEDAAETAEDVDDRLDAQFEELETRVNEGLHDAEARVDEELADVEDRVDEALAELDDVEETIEEQVEEELDDLWTAVDDAAREAEDVAGELRAFRQEVDEDAGERVDELEREVEELSEELEDVAEMRDRLASALGGLAPQDDGGDADGDADGGDEEDEE